MKKHSDFSPSSFERRFLCSASYMMEKDLPPTKSKYADEGTLLHELVTIDIREYLRIQNDKPVLDAYLHYLENVKHSENINKHLIVDCFKSFVEIKKQLFDVDVKIAKDRVIRIEMTDLDDPFTISQYF